MKVKIKEYHYWLSLYGILHKVFPASFMETDFMSWLTLDSKLSDLYSVIMLPVNNYYENARVNVKIHDYDLWNLDSTLARIIVPALIAFKDAGNLIEVELDDVPGYLVPNIPMKNAYSEWDVLYKARSRWALNEMIWAFSSTNADDLDLPYHDEKHRFDVELYEAHYKRVLHGRALFAKYYDFLWD